MRHFIKSAIVPACLIAAVGCTANKTFQVNNSYRLEKVTYEIRDEKIREALKDRETETAFAKDQKLKLKTFEKERKRIEKLVRKNIDPDFNKSNIWFLVDTTRIEGKFLVRTIIKSE